MDDSMSDWEPEKYLKFKQERTRPVHDLISRVELQEPERILDIGCGPGNSTAPLRERWPFSDIVGIDNSPAMVDRAQCDHPDIKFIVMDAGKDLSTLGEFDLVFANASLQWIPDHEALLPRLLGILRSGGVLAVQIPQFDEMPISKALAETITSSAWSAYFSGFEPGFTFRPARAYYDILSGVAKDMQLWSIDYYHIMPSHAAIMDMMESTGLRPYLDRLPSSQWPAFKRAVIERLKTCYPCQSDGSVLFPFKRLFIVARP